MDDLSRATWVKSSYSGGNGGNCVEIAWLGGDVTAVRDSKNPGGPVVRFGGAAWEAFRGGVKGGSLTGIAG
ncbi:DUF397 domain-containing protein [Sphaerisporangium sp. TRM90804]|uniref:DUF397 domain-containing protein n=1 Tax=Sphaerisporangium sp. TRM90804 TaxID=3031113 RepID=UPI002448A60B|nr:DUF397 domain-containing protein [Sphaerisporangium sp. TRM90804]MDH2424489.1 DUF397 domain-containing protein [Sphaerisporangium sp. TRM90804]